MCGIVGAIAQRDVSPILLEGLKRLEYRGYDSAGVAIIDSQRQLHRLRVLGKVNNFIIGPKRNGAKIMLFFCIRNDQCCAGFACAMKRQNLAKINWAKTVTV